MAGIRDALGSGKTTPQIPAHIIGPWILSGKTHFQTKGTRAVPTTGMPGSFRWGGS